MRVFIQTIPYTSIVGGLRALCRFKNGRYHFQASFYIIRGRSRCVLCMFDSVYDYVRQSDLRGVQLGDRGVAIPVEPRGCAHVIVTLHPVVALSEK